MDRSSYSICLMITQVIVMKCQEVRNIFFAFKLKIQKRYKFKTKKKKFIKFFRFSRNLDSEFLI